ncbi:MAG: hypothetical protein GY806_17465 [Gammaproteobacteria bacterium]|nr:hypothetical protein [Gammaproteobacteria bacterium]
MSMLLAFTTLVSASNVLAYNNLSDSLLDQTQAWFCAESDSDLIKKKKKLEGEEEEEEEEPDCD